MLLHREFATSLVWFILELSFDLGEVFIDLSFELYRFVVLLESLRENDLILIDLFIFDRLLIQQDLSSYSVIASIVVLSITFDIHLFFIEDTLL